MSNSQQMNVPKSFRLHIGLFGRRNAGKSSLLNAITRQKTSIVSDVAGTTADPVEKPMELLPIGPVLFIDTAGVDDQGTLGELRVEKTRQIFDRTEIGLIVVDLSRPDAEIWSRFEEEIVSELKRRNVPVLVVFNKLDLLPNYNVFKTENSRFFEHSNRLKSPDLLMPEPPESKSSVFKPLGTNLTDSKPLVSKPVEETEHSSVSTLQKVLISLRERDIPFLAISSEMPESAAEIRQALIRIVPEEFLSPPPIVSDLVAPGELIVLVVPIDKEAPKGRLILPQVQTIRDILDGDQYCVVVKEHQLADALRRMSPPPKLVVTDSQAFRQVSETVPLEIPLTSFSVLFARQKGDLATMIQGAQTIRTLTAKSRVLIAESCSHHPIAEDIGTEKIPNWLRAKVSPELFIDHVQGHDFPATKEELAQWDLVIHCGACMWNRREMLSRLMRCAEAGVPITNYGLAIAMILGIFDRAVAPFQKKIVGK